MMSAPPEDRLADDDLDTTARLPILSPADIVEAGGPWDLADELVPVRERIASLEAALGETESRLTQLQARHDSLQSHHAELLIHSQVVSRDRDRLAEEGVLGLASRQQLQDQLEQQQRTQDELQHQLTEARTEAEQSRQQSEALQAELLAAHQQVAEQHASAAALARSTAQTLLEKDDLQRSLLAREQVVAALEGRLSDTSAELASAIANGESLQHELAERQSDIGALHEAQAALAQREATLLDNVSLLREELGQLQLQLQERDQTLAVQAERIANLSATVERLQDELAAKHLEQGASARQIEALQAELHQHVEAMHAIRRDIHQVALQTRRNQGETLLRTLTRDDVEGVVHLLNKSSISIGRDPECDIQLRSSSVSRYHAVLRISHDAVIIEDMNSTNGCYVNGRRITRQLLRDGDLLRVGAIPLRFGSRATQD